MSITSISPIPSPLYQSEQEAERSGEENVPPSKGAGLLPTKALQRGEERLAHPHAQSQAAEPRQSATPAMPYEYHAERLGEHLLLQGEGDLEDNHPYTSRKSKRSVCSTIPKKVRNRLLSPHPHSSTVQHGALNRSGVLRSLTPPLGSYQAVTEQAQWQDDPEAVAITLAPWQLPLPERAAPTPKQLEQALSEIVGELKLPTAPGESQRSLTYFVGRASMDQMMMVLTTLVGNITANNTQSLFESQKINAEATNRITEQQLHKQIEEAEKAQQAQEDAKKRGLVGMIFGWLGVVVEAIVCVVAPFSIPLMAIAIACTIGQAALSSVAFDMLCKGKEVPAWMAQLGMGLAIASMVVTLGSNMLCKSGNALAKISKTTWNEGFKAGAKVAGKSLLQGSKAAYQSLCSIIKESLTKLRAFLTKCKEGISKLLSKGKEEGLLSTEVAKAVEDAADEAAFTAAKTERNANLYKGAAQGAEKILDTAELATSIYYSMKSGNIQAALKTLQNENWFLGIILDYYQYQKDQIHKNVATQFELQGDAIAIGSQAIQESASLQARIASSLA